MIIAGTGHRPDKLGGYDGETADRLCDFAIEHLTILKPDLVISGMALGWDMALAEAAHALEIPFHAYLPFRGQESKWPRGTQRFYQNLLAVAAKIYECAEPGYAAWKMQVRNKCMVDALTGPRDTLLALWNGSDGGTANCVAYATKQGKTIINLWEHYV